MLLYWARADGTGVAEALTSGAGGHRAGSWHPNGRFLAFSENPTGRGQGQTWNIMILPINGSDTDGWKPGQPFPFANASFNEADPTFSPDGRWIAYASDESGQAEIYVRPFDSAGGKVQISNGGGQGAVWSKTRSELLYMNRDQRLMSVMYAIYRGEFRPQKPVVWSDQRIDRRNIFGSFRRPFDLHPDGERIVMAPERDGSQSEKQDHAVFVLNFFDELRRLAPAARR